MPALCTLAALDVPVTPRQDKQETSAQEELDIMLTAIKTETFLLTVSRPTESDDCTCKLGTDPLNGYSEANACSFFLFSFLCEMSQIGK